MKKIIFTLIAVAFLFVQGISQISLNHYDVAIPLTKYAQYSDTLPLQLLFPELQEQRKHGIFPHCRSTTSTLFSSPVRNGRLTVQLFPIRTCVFIR